MRECRGVYNLLRRSGINDINQFKKCLFTSSKTHCKDSSQKSSEKSSPSKKDEKKEDAPLKTGSEEKGKESKPASSQKGKEKEKLEAEKEKNKKDEEEKIPEQPSLSILTIKLAIMLAVCFYLMTLFPRSKSSDALYEDSVYISFKEFVYQMLAKGEVDKIIIRPDASLVLVFLHEGAVIKGRKVSFLD